MEAKERVSTATRKQTLERGFMAFLRGLLQTVMAGRFAFNPHGRPRAFCLLWNTPRLGVSVLEVEQNDTRRWRQAWM
jgi:hypothetical protein